MPKKETRVGRIKTFLFQCMSCAFKLESENAPFECPECKSNSTFAKIGRNS